MIDKAAITNTAQKLAAKGQIDKAIAEYEKLLASGKDGNVYNTIGDLYLKKGAETEAVISFTKAAELFKKDGFYPKAIALYKKILNIVPNDVNSLISLGKLNAERDLIGSAIEYYFKAAEIYHREGSTENATTVVERILQLSPSDPDTRKKIAYLYFRLGLRKRAANEYAAIASDFLKNNALEQAEEMCRQAIEFDKENTQALICLSKLAEHRDNTDAAFEYLEEAVSLEPDNKALLLDYAAALIKHNRTDEAMTALIKLIESHPSDQPAKKMLGTLYLNEGLTDKAWDELLPCIDKALEAGQWSDADELLQHFKEGFPLPVHQRFLQIYRAQGDSGAIQSELNELARLHESDDNYEDALQLYKEVLEVSPDDSTAMEKVHALEITLGIAEPAEEVAAHEDTVPVDDALQHNNVTAEEASPQMTEHPQPEDTYQDNTPPHAEVIHFEEVLSPPVEQEAEETVSAPEEPAEAPAFNLAERKAEADFFAQQGLKNEALAIYRELLTYDPENEELNSKVNALQPSSENAELSSDSADIEVQPVQADDSSGPTSVDDDLKDIFSAFGSAEEEPEEDYDARYQAGLEFRQKGLLDDAISNLQIAARDPEKQVRNSTMLALCYMEKGSYPLAIAGFTKVMDLMSPADSTYIHVKYELASAHLMNKDNSKALELYTEIEAARPDFKDVADKLRLLQSASPENGDKPKKDRVSYI